MPIYEFKCLECEDLFEILTLKSSDEEEIKCPHCGAQHFERVMSATSYAMAPSGGTGKGGGISKQERTCSAGSCSTYTIPGMN
ncbi:zinc ribbon domain-containing protein [Desulfobotulus sp. H1]|uniref:Zinc ribbon domain-containing protein n=1 Tax=Desulfobotulus pelophilus TaxID=2823377 RepID=A0ABT3N6R8_9BACT|nr:zinc ribbon domain-containing protein [Desulfobotulus pelophilus]MCW7753159.1 zinc ribbon domain-containing protein [Desulfobotulus pelophilus]